MTRDELLEALLVERYQPTRPESVAGYGPAVTAAVRVMTDDSELTVARRRRSLRAALEGYEDHRRAAQ